MNIVLVVGDFFVDRYHLAYAGRRSAEVDIPVWDVYKMFEQPGGAGNVAENLRMLGIDVLSDPGMPAKDPWQPTYAADGAITTPVKNRLLVDGKQVARWDEHDYCELADPLQIENHVENSEVEAIIVADYCKGSVHTAVRKAILGSGLPIYVDTKDDPIVWDYYGADVTFFPNLAEYMQYPTYDNCDKVVLKKGAAGLSEIINRRTTRWYPALADQVVSVNGAGDTVMAAYVAAKLIEHTNPTLVAAAASALVVEKPYTTTTTWKEIHGKLRGVNTSVQDKSGQASVPSRSGSIGVGGQANSGAGRYGDSGGLGTFVSDPTDSRYLMRVA